MIVENNSLTTIGLGSQKQIPQAGDTSLKLPNLVMPVIRLVEPLEVLQSSIVPMDTSFCTESIFQKNNAAQAIEQMCVLKPGLWEINIEFALKITTATTIPVGTFANRVYIDIGGFAVTLLIFLVRSTGQFSLNKTVQVLLRDESTLHHQICATGAGDFIDQQVSLVCNRLL